MNNFYSMILLVRGGVCTIPQKSSEHDVFKTTKHYFSWFNGGEQYMLGLKEVARLSVGFVHRQLIMLDGTLGSIQSYSFVLSFGVMFR